jgi:hypothetical protein
MNRADLKLLVFLVLATLLAIPVSRAAGAATSGEAIICGPHGHHTVVSLESDGLYRIEGRVGEVVFEVRDGRLMCVSSTCSDKTCVHMGAVAAGRPVVCAPNGVSAMFVSKPSTVEEASLDAVSR